MKYQVMNNSRNVWLLLGVSAVICVVVLCIPMDILPFTINVGAKAVVFFIFLVLLSFYVAFSLGGITESESKLNTQSLRFLRDFLWILPWIMIMLWQIQYYIMALFSFIAMHIDIQDGAFGFHLPLFDF